MDVDVNVVVNVNGRSVGQQPFTFTSTFTITTTLKMFPSGPSEMRVAHSSCLSIWRPERLTTGVTPSRRRGTRFCHPATLVNDDATSGYPVRSGRTTA